MDHLLTARLLFSYSLIFHIAFAVMGVGFPLMMVIAEWRWMRTGEDIWLSITQRWAKGTAILFAIGAASGTLISFELGLLWPGFMKFAGSIIGLPFALEGFAFFAEAIFLGIYLYGWNKVSRQAHLLAGCVVTVSGAASAVLVMTANAWMNNPTGFELLNGQAINVDPIAAMLNPASFTECIHMLLASYVAAGFGVAGVHAFMLLRDAQNLFHRKAFKIAFAVGALAMLLQFVSGDLSARYVAREEPVKFAAMEGQFKTEQGAPLRLGGFPSVKDRETKWAIEIPSLLSFIAFGDQGAELKGLEAFPEDEWPPVLLTHLAYQVMIGCGVTLTGLGFWALFLKLRRRSLYDSKLFLRAAAVATPLGFLAVESGWIVTEVGRQPWVIAGLMRTAEAVTPVPSLLFPFILFAILFVLLSIVTVWLLTKLTFSCPDWPLKGGS